jgi:hypothetical protein
MKMDLDSLNQRFERIEKSIELIRDNHLAHIERYTRWTLIGIVFSTSASLLAVAITVL